jgi:hypothetical protein
MAPEQFWRLSPTEFWWLFDARKQTIQARQQQHGGLTEADREELYQHLREEGALDG